MNHNNSKEKKLSSGRVTSLSSTEPWPMDWRCSKRSCPARLTSEGVEVTQQTGHNHAIDSVEAQVERVKHNLRKRAREEVTPIPSIYSDALVDIATNSEENEALAVVSFDFS